MVLIMNNDIYINGKFLIQKLSGIQRHAIELIKAIDLCISENKKFSNLNLIILIPSDSNIDPYNFKSIKIKKVKILFNKFIWEQVQLPLLSYKKKLLNLTGSSPAFKLNQNCTYADMAIFESHKAYQYKYVLFYRFLFKFQSLVIKKIYTISNFSKSRINSILNIPNENIIVLGCSAEHMLNSISDNNIFKKIGIKNKYYLCVGSNNINKNISLVLKLFTSNYYFDDFKLVIVGNFNIKIFSNDTNIPIDSKNIIFTGEISDSELKALYENAIAFIFPSIYEGFGIPPVEAMYCNCPVIASNIDVLNEVCGSAALYFNPYSESELFYSLRQVYSDSLIRSNLIKLGSIQARKYSWKSSALSILDDLVCSDK
jgi:glycosyltransferase involved in cell wall biosynthesis